MTADLLSEPAGTLALAVAVLAFVWALRGESTRRYAVAGALIGVATLVRADFLFLPLILALLVRRRGPVLALIACAALVIAPWSIYISARAGHPTLVSTGDAPVLFIGTCLPCDGTLLGLKQTYGSEARRRDRALRRLPDSRLPASAVLDAIAARHPGRDRESALRAESVRNLGHDLRHPFAYAGMELRKLRQLWLRPSRIGTSERPAAVTVVHVVLIGLAFAGLIAGLIRARSRELTAIALVLAYGTAVHLFTTADSRYNLRSCRCCSRAVPPVCSPPGPAGASRRRRRRGHTRQRPRAGRSPARRRSSSDARSAVQRPDSTRWPTRDSTSAIAVRSASSMPAQKISVSAASRMRCCSPASSFAGPRSSSVRTTRE